MIAVDFETFYNKTYSLKNLGAWAYCFNEQFDAYLVAIVREDLSIVFVGNPRDFDWSSLAGETLVAHNASFDGLVVKRLQKDGVIPESVGKDWICTADLAVYLQAPRALKGAAKELLGVTMSKDLRDIMKGKTYHEAKAEGLGAKLDEYVAFDAINSMRIALLGVPQWPAGEREVSRLNRESAWHGVHVDRTLVKAGYASAATQKLEALRLMVWADDENDTPLSLAKIREYGRQQGIMVPCSLAIDSPDAAKWYAEYGVSHPWVSAIRDYRRLNTICKKIQVLDGEADENDVYHFAIKYFGAGPGRFSGGGRFNMQNLPRGPIFGINMRNFITARPGYRFLLPDYSQIEARMLLWRVGDMEFINIIREVGNIYTAYAIRTGEYSGRKLKKDNPKLYQLTKTKVLGLGYGMGPAKFRTTAARDGIQLTETEAKEAVKDYRNKNTRIVEFWKHHDMWLKVSATHQDDSHVVTLRSGRKLKYFNPKWRVSEDVNGRQSRSVHVQMVRGGPELHYYGGKMVENEIQATARDVLCDAWVGLYKAGYNVLFTAHDEFIIEVPEAACNDETKHDVRRILLSSSPWAEGCPLDADLDDMKYSDFYTK